MSMPSIADRKPSAPTAQLAESDAEQQLEEGLENSFPCSDPVAVVSTLTNGRRPETGAS